MLPSELSLLEDIVSLLKAGISIDEVVRFQTKAAGVKKDPAELRKGHARMLRTLRNRVRSGKSSGHVDDKYILGKSYHDAGAKKLAARMGHKEPDQEPKKEPEKAHEPKAHVKLGHEAHKASAAAHDAGEKADTDHSHLQAAVDAHQAAHDAHLKAARAHQSAGEHSTAATHVGMAKKHAEKIGHYQKIAKHQSWAAHRKKTGTDESREWMEAQPLLGQGRRSYASALDHLKAAGFEPDWISEQERLKANHIDVPTLEESRRRLDEDEGEQWKLKHDVHHPEHGPLHISTVELPHHAGGGHETMVFKKKKGKIDYGAEVDSDRYDSRKDAEAGHHAMVRKYGGKTQEESRRRPFDEATEPPGYGLAKRRADQASARAQASGEKRDHKDAADWHFTAGRLSADGELKKHHFAKSDFHNSKTEAVDRTPAEFSHIADKAPIAQKHTAHMTAANAHAREGFRHAETDPKKANAHFSWEKHHRKQAEFYRGKTEDVASVSSIEPPKNKKELDEKGKKSKWLQRKESMSAGGVGTHALGERLDPNNSDHHPYMNALAGAVTRGQRAHASPSAETHAAAIKAHTYAAKVAAHTAAMHGERGEGYFSKAETMHMRAAGAHQKLADRLSARKTESAGVPKHVKSLEKRILKKEPGYTPGKAMPTAWSIFCKHVSPDSPHCHKRRSQYFKNKGK